MLHLNKTYEMENFKVVTNDLVVKACQHRFRLIVTGATVITAEDFPDIPMATLNFKDLVMFWLVNTDQICWLVSDS